MHREARQVAHPPLEPGKGHAPQEAGHHGANGNQATGFVFVGLGRDSGIRPADIVGCIANETNLEGRQIGPIRITDRYSVVGVPAERLDEPRHVSGDLLHAVRLDWLWGVGLAVAADVGRDRVVAGDREAARHVLDVLVDAAVDEAPPLDILLAHAKNLQREKWDWALPEELLRKAYASQYLDIDEALSWVQELAKKTGPAK